MTSCTIISRELAIQYTHIPAGMPKPINNDMPGPSRSRDRFILGAAWSLFIWLVFWVTIMDTRDSAAEITGSRNSPTDPQDSPPSQNFSWGILDRSMPKKSKLMTNMPAADTPAAAAAVLAVSRFPAFIMAPKVSSL